MDPLEIIANVKCVFPFFQPIFSADEHRIIGYEVLGRYRSEQEVVSLGPFFQDETIPEEYRLEVDNAVLKKALDKSLSLEEDVLLFINRDADLIMYDHGEQLLDILLQYQEKGFSLNRIVIEITEKNYSGTMDHLDHLLNYYKTYGIKIAVDKLGADSTQLDRIGQLAPNILKVDLKALRSNTVQQSFHDILYSISLLSRKIGATLLFENIEMEFQLQFAWRNGGRYYQGFYLQQPSPDFIDRDILKTKLRQKCHQFISYEKKKLESFYQFTDQFNQRMQQFVGKNKNQLQNDLLMELAERLKNIAFRLYICDDEGFQQSPNIFYSDNHWQVQNEYLHKNWSWRPYFLENIMKMKSIKKGILSDLYTDIETGEMIRTFSYPLREDEYVFIDISYSFLFEHEGLL
ncbi:EAL-associated domain-containing protein [Cytobacillus gottheilii]|uniref:EAL domain-containing protein n=1 Tax=Cytobacillus gottheilii TaxID=859144 RepID=A0ABX8FGG5_9BACI|nr:EAL domain-containing protein [Cytobacillus gottheilii]QVY63106.1 EAL domain-containing protein [Cytobacillus gottheilii]